LAADPTDTAVALIRWTRAQRRCRPSRVAAGDLVLAEDHGVGQGGNRLSGLIPLSAATDRIGLAAMRCAGLLARLAAAAYRYWPVVALSVFDTRTDTTLARLMTTAFSPASRLYRA
jgi:hypothetical protein